MSNNDNLMISIKNVRKMINNALLMLRDLDGILSKKGFQPVSGNRIGTETSKSIHQTMSDDSTFFPQFMARQYALERNLNAKKLRRIILVNIQFYHAKTDPFVPTISFSVITLPEVTSELYVENWWLKYTVHEDRKWKDDVKNNGEEHLDKDEHGIQTRFWCRDLLSIDGQENLIQEADRMVLLFQSDHIENS